MKTFGAILGACLAIACRAQPLTTPRTDEVILVTPDSGPSPLHGRLGSMDPTPTSTSTESRRLEAALDAFYAKTAPRRGYIAVDKPLYQPGEAIWFRLFDLASGDLKGTEKDVATVKLISPRGQTVLEKRLLVDHGHAANDFLLDRDLAGGEYILRAESPNGSVTERKVIVSAYEAPRIKKQLEFVRKAYGPGDTVVATLSLARATGEPLANRSITGLVTLDGNELARVPVTTDARGNALVKVALPAHIAKGDGLLTILVDDGGVTESVQKRIPILLRDLSFAAYPEGGDLVVGLPGRVYFQAKNALDKPADVEGRVVDDRGRVAALFRSYHDGLGRFELHPEPGRTYHVEIGKPVGIAKHYPLPAARERGCTMQALDDYSSARPDLRVAVWCTSSQEIVAGATLREQRVAAATAKVVAGQPAIVSLPMPAGVQGAVRVTVFDKQLAPLAERLVYRNRGRDLKIAITADKPTYHPRDGVTLAIETRGPDGAPVAADLALSVVDDTVLAFADDKQATLLARLYLEAELPGQKIEEPNFYFGTDAKAPAALDLVMGSHGWRRFDWKPVLAAPPAPPITEPWTFTGEYWKTKAKRPIARPGKPAAVAPEPADQVAEARPAPRPKQPVAAGPRPAAKPDAKPAAKDLARPLPPRDEPAPMAPAPMIDRGGVDDAEEEADFAGEAIALERRPARNKNFDIGAEQQRKRRMIRDKADRDDGDYQPDPYCCLEPERQFPMPQYTARHDGPRTDFRETLLWKSRVQTDASGKATLSLYLSDAVTSFKVAAEGVGGGRLGRGEAQLQSKKPVSLAVKLPLEVSAGDKLRLPVTIANETALPYTAHLDAKFGKAFALRGGALPPQITLAPNERRATFYELDVVGDGKILEDGKIAIAVTAANLEDAIERTVNVQPIGFPQEVSIAGTLGEGAKRIARHEIEITDVLPGTMRGVVSFYPSPLATMVKGTEAMIAEPGGCFEQASSTNYPNIMILSYLEEHGQANPDLVTKTQGVLDRGYKLLTGYETKERGYEWFGGAPGHEALTAYGLMEFRDMQKVYGAVDKTMVERTRQWLRNRRDGKGGFVTNPKALDSFGRASPEVTDGYITYALAQAGEKDLGPEIARQQQVAQTTKDPYVLALATQVLLDTRAKDPATRAAVQKLAAMQASDGGFSGADHSITRSGGEALAIETTALAALALMDAGSEFTPHARKAVEWLNAHRDGSGNYGSTQSTVLSLKAMAAYAKDSRRTEAPGTIKLRINGREAARVPYAKGHQGAIELIVAEHLRPGKNVVEIELESTQPLPYSGAITWGSKVPASSAQTKVKLETQLPKTTVKLGESTRMDVRVTNITNRGIPMTLARVGLPGGLTFQTWQLQELRDKKIVDFYETRPREVILYFRAMAPGSSIDVPLELMSTVPGTFTAPASRAYLYYTDEHKHWVAPAVVTVTQ